MKKWIVLMVLGCMMLFSSMALAGDSAPAPVYPETDGTEIGSALDADIITDHGAGYWGRESYNTALDVNGNQSANLDVKVEAFLPCYLEMRITGNDLNQILQSWGNDRAANKSIDNPYIAFYPRASGFVDGDWNLLAPGGAEANHTEIVPGAGKYIRSCDVIKAELYSNMDYTYSVKVQGGALTPGADVDTTTKLPVQMRTATSYPFTATNYTLFSFSETSDTAPIVDGDNACVRSSFWHQFRVPFGDQYGAGKYSSRIEFQAVTK